METPNISEKELDTETALIILINAARIGKNKECYTSEESIWIDKAINLFLKK